jgi:hypothetical protein
MLLRFRNVVLSAAALCATAAFAAEPRMVDVPFSFVAKNHAYQAGSYVISVDWTRSMVTLTEIGKRGQKMAWILLPGDSDPNHAKVSLTFDVNGTDHVLRTIQYQTFITPNLDTKPRQPMERITTIGE